MKSEKTKLKDKCEALAKKIVKIRDNFTDQRTGERVEGVNCHASHIIPVSAGLRFAFDTKNMIVLSYHNHINWWHKNPLEAAEWYKKKFPENYKYLEERKKEKREPLHIAYYHAVYERLQEEFKSLKQKHDKKI